jgi:uncharacterized glyoxalase superfamily protein PhnB
MKLYTHLTFGGNCEEVFRFSEKHLGGKISMMMKQSAGTQLLPIPGPGLRRSGG